jgi:hypothetical protein
MATTPLLPEGQYSMYERPADAVRWLAGWPQQLGSTQVRAWDTIFIAAKLEKATWNHDLRDRTQAPNQFGIGSADPKALGAI